MTNKIKIVLFILLSIYEFIVGCYAITTVEYDYEIHIECGKYFWPCIASGTFCNILIPIATWLSLYYICRTNNNNDYHNLQDIILQTQANNKVMIIMYVMQCFQIFIMVYGYTLVNNISDSCMTLIENNSYLYNLIMLEQVIFVIGLILLVVLFCIVAIKCKSYYDKKH